MKIKTILLFLILLTPLFFDSIVYAAHEQKKIKRQKISLTAKQQNIVDQNLYTAIENDNFEGVIGALNAGAYVTNTQTNKLKKLPTEIAAKHNCSPNIFKALFSHGADPQSNPNLLYLLTKNVYTCKPHLVETIKTLLQQKVSLHLNDYKNNTPLHQAAKSYQQSMTYGKDADSYIGWKEKIPLWYRAIELLLFAGADHEKKNNKNKIALDLIDQEYQAPIARLINLASFFNLSKNLPSLLLSHIAAPKALTIILDYIDPLYADKNSPPTEEEQKLWDELDPIREIQQKLLMAPASLLPEEEKQ